MTAKPFIAARIPESLNLRLEEHSKSTGENRTQILVNALAAYLGYAPEVKDTEIAGDRLSLLEKKVAELEKLVKEPRQISLLDTSTITTEKLTTKVESSNKLDNAFDGNAQPQAPVRNKLNNHEMAALTPFTYESVRSKHKRNNPIEVNGESYLPIKEGSSCKWQLLA